MEALLEQTTKAVARKQVDADILKDGIHFLEEEEKRRRNRIVFYLLPSFLLFLCRDSFLIILILHQSPLQHLICHQEIMILSEYRNKQKNSKQKGGNLRETSLE
jgi:hypothetical protein